VCIAIEHGVVGRPEHMVSRVLNEAHWALVSARVILVDKGRGCKGTLHIRFEIL
jgi:hypothetical protein